MDELGVHIHEWATIGEIYNNRDGIVCYRRICRRCGEVSRIQTK